MSCHRRCPGSPSAAGGLQPGGHLPREKWAHRCTSPAKEGRRRLHRSTVHQDAASPALAVRTVSLPGSLCFKGGGQGSCWSRENPKTWRDKSSRRATAQEATGPSQRLPRHLKATSASVLSTWEALSWNLLSSLSRQNTRSSIYTVLQTPERRREASWASSMEDEEESEVVGAVESQWDSVDHSKPCAVLMECYCPGFAESVGQRVWVLLLFLFLVDKSSMEKHCLYIIMIVITHNYLHWHSRPTFFFPVSHSLCFCTILSSTLSLSPPESRGRGDLQVMTRDCPS